MACNKPVITTDHRGCRDAIADSAAGILIPVKSPTSLAENIILLADDRDLRHRMGAAGRKRVEQSYEASQRNAVIRAAVAGACRLTSEEIGDPRFSPLANSEECNGRTEW